MSTAVISPAVMGPDSSGNSRVIELLEQLVKLQTPGRFNVGDAACGVIAAAIGFVIALAANDFFTKLFAKVKVGGGLLGAAIYLLVMLVLGLFLIFVIFIWVQPWLHSKFA
jgi:hypothetical protein